MEPLIWKDVGKYKDPILREEQKENLKSCECGYILTKQYLPNNKGGVCGYRSICRKCGKIINN